MITTRLAKRMWGREESWTVNRSEETIYRNGWLGSRVAFYHYGD